VLSYGALRVLEGQMSLGVMLAVNALAGALLTPMSSLVQSMLSLQRVRGYLERLQDVLEVEPEQDAASKQAPPRLRGQIELDNVSFRYSDGGPMVVRDASLAIEPGQSVAIVGASGSGKSTLASLLLGLHRPTEGRILFDRRDLAELDLGAVRSQLGTVPQAPYFFDASVRENVSLAAPGAPLERVVAAAKAACIHDDIAAMPMGYEALMADRGQSMSGGQLQRLALARALVARPAVLLLDEATSALDTETEARVVQNLRGLRMTRIFIAHRLSTVIDADLIVVMDQGRVVETGTHAALLARGGRYAALVRAQLGGAASTPSTRNDPDAKASIRNDPDRSDSDDEHTTIRSRPHAVGRPVDPGL
jgi:ATP-binding cassette, subfamily B, bacterial